MFLRTFKILLLTGLLLISLASLAQISDITPIDDLQQPVDTITTALDTLPTKQYKVSLDKIDCIVKRRSDSSYYEQATNVVEMYGNAVIEYCDMTLEAEQINYNTKTQIAEAFGVKDSTGFVTKYAIFNDGTQELQYESLKFNFKTQKGIVQQLVTKQGEGVVRGKKVKKKDEDEYFVKDLIYSTCNLDHPHYYFTFGKAVYKNDKFAAGKHLNLYIKDIPTPLYFPFAIFPMEQGKRAGFTRFGPGYDQTRGFSLSGLGWYQPINDNMDVEATADYYTSGSYNINTRLNYIKRYKHRMNLDFRYSKFKNINFNEAIGGQYENSFEFRYTFNQDPKVWPTANLNANIQLGQRNFRQFNVVDPQERLNNNYSSSISFNKSFRTLPVSFSSNIRYNQNTQSNVVSLSLPEINLSTSTLTPFRGISKPGKQNPLETLSVRYTSNYKNRINSIDSIFFNNPLNEISNVDFGATHSIPVSLNMKFLKYFNFSPSVNYNESWTNETFRQRWNSETNRIERDTIREFRTARWYTPSAGINTTVYGGKTFKPDSKIQAIRHVMRPSVSFSYTPDFKQVETSKGRYFNQVQYNADGDMRYYSIFDGAIVGGPPQQEGGSINFNLGNNLEMKVKSKKDTTNGGIKKVKIFESLNFNTSYNLGADSLKVAPISFSGNTTLLDKFRINLSGNFNPYEIDPVTGRRINTLTLSNGKLPILNRASMNISGNLKSKASNEHLETEAQLINNPLYPGEQLFADNYHRSYVNFNIPWDLGFNYSLNYGKQYLPNNQSNTTLSNKVLFNFNFNLTDNWKVQGKSGYDFDTKSINYTNFRIHRDLHCWQMSFNWSPVGVYKQYYFTISPKSSMLRDLKIDKKRTVFDNFRD